ncbi:hypothetical protein ACPC54_08185 [Kitasatospora sp. NPDC094028]
MRPDSRPAPPDPEPPVPERPDFRAALAQGPEAAATAEEAVALIVASLPADLGEVFNHPAEDGD